MALFRTIDGRSLSTVVQEAREMTEGHLKDVVVKFTIDGATSSQIGNEGKYVDVEFDNIEVKMTRGRNSIVLPNYGHWGTLNAMIDKAAELLLFMITDEDVEDN